MIKHIWWYQLRFDQIHYHSCLRQANTLNICSNMVIFLSFSINTQSFHFVFILAPVEVDFCCMRFNTLLNVFSMLTYHFLRPLIFPCTATVKQFEHFYQYTIFPNSFIWEKTTINGDIYNGPVWWLDIWWKIVSVLSRK